MLELILLPQLQDNYAFLIGDEKSKKAMAIDPSEGEPIAKILETRGWSLELIINTHHHWDHVGGNEYLKRYSGCEIATSAFDNHRIAGASKILEPDQKYQFVDSEFEVFLIPGHTLGHMAVKFREPKWLFCGDTLFSLGCGRLFEGTPEQMLTSLKLLALTSPDYQIYCGHEYTHKNWQFAQSIEPDNLDLKQLKVFIDKKRSEGAPTFPTDWDREYKCNPFFRLHSPNIRRKLKLEEASELAVFTALRELRNNF